ncbi:hypothetical protein ACFQU7_38125 [Pseudoroseomonas wenyumeiae]
MTLLLTTGAAPTLLFAATLSQCLARNDGRLWLGGLSRPWPAGLPRPQGRPDATPLLGALDNAALARGLACLGQKLGCGPLTAEALWLTGLVLALRDGCHLDEVMVLTGLHRPGLA